MHNFKTGDPVVISDEACTKKNRGLYGVIETIETYGTANVRVPNEDGTNRMVPIHIGLLEPMPWTQRQPKVRHDIDVFDNVRHDTDAPDAKLSNPKDIIGSTKPGLDALSMPVLFEMGAGMADGGYKYGRQNYRVVGVRASVYYNAAMRHLAAFWEGEDIDPDSGLSHITKVMTCLHVLRDSQIMGNDVDDRPVRPPKDWMKRAQGHTDQVLARHPNPVPPFLHKS